MIHPVVCNPVLSPVVRVTDPVRWRAGKLAPEGAILHFDADIDPYTEQTGGPHTFNHAVLSPQYQRNADGSYTDVGAKVAADFYGGERWLRSCGAVTNLLPSGYPFSGLKVEVSADGLYTRLINLTTDEWAGSYTSLPLPTGSKYTFETVVRAGVGANKFGLGFHAGTFLPITATIQGPGECLVVDNYCKVSGLSTTEDTTISITLNSELATALALHASPCGIESAEVGDYTLIRNFQLTATSYPVPYTPPGTTMPASNATTTNGCWFALPNGSPLWQGLDGKADGVELVANGVYKLKNAEVVRDTITLTGASNEVSFSGMDYNIGTIAGQRYVAHISGVASVLTANETVSIRGVTNIGVIKSNEAFNFQHQFTATANYNAINIYGNGVGNIVITNVSVQRIQPQPLTLATRVRMGVGSGDLPNSSTLNILTPDDVAGRFLTIQKDAGGALTAVLNDGTNPATVTLAAWNRGDVLHFFPQVLTGATQMRIGYKSFAATSITWGTAATYAGTFGPDATLKRLMIGYNAAQPQGINKLTIVPGQIADAEILGWWK